MKKYITILKFSLLFLVFLWFLTSCKKEKSEGENAIPTGNTGQVVFWVAEDIGYVTINIDGVNQGTIKGYYYGGEPDCGDAKCLTVTLKGGSHNYSASGNFGTINKNFTVISNICNAVKVFGDKKN